MPNDCNVSSTVQFVTTAVFENARSARSVRLVIERCAVSPIGKPELGSVINALFRRRFPCRHHGATAQCEAKMLNVIIDSEVASMRSGQDAKMVKIVSQELDGCR